jgi:hypothetical protein
MTSAQILSGKGGEIVVEILPTDTEIDNADYAGIIRYGSDDESAFSTTEVVDGVTVYKEPVTINAEGAKARYDESSRVPKKKENFTLN